MCIYAHSNIHECTVSAHTQTVAANMDKPVSHTNAVQNPGDKNIGKVKGPSSLIHTALITVVCFIMTDNTKLFC